MNMNDASLREARLLRTSKAVVISIAMFLKEKGRGVLPAQIIAECLELGEAVEAYKKQQPPPPIDLEQYFDGPGR